MPLRSSVLFGVSQSEVFSKLLAGISSLILVSALSKCSIVIDVAHKCGFYVEWNYPHCDAQWYSFGAAMTILRQRARNREKQGES